MKILYENLWNYKDTLYSRIVVTTNSYINSKNELVMGRGAALEASRFYPKLPRLAALEIKKQTTHLGVYGFIKIFTTPIGLFQVKQHFKDKADLELIKLSTSRLGIYAASLPSKFEIHMNYPAIGYGELRREEIEPIIVRLPDNVYLHIKG